MNQQTLLQEIGLSEKEAHVYQTLLSLGVVPAKRIAQKTGMPRGTTYEMLKLLEEKDLIEEFEQQKKAHFRAKHPLALKEYLENKSTDISRTHTKLDVVFQDFETVYSHTQKRPGVRFFEGEDGIKKVVEDALTSKTPIYTYADIEAITKHADEINKEFVKKREKLGIKKKGFVLDTPFAREYLKDYHPSVTDTKFIQIKKTIPFETVMQIYDNKVSYLTLTDDTMIGVIISDKHIYQMHKSLFEHLWEITPDNLSAKKIIKNT